MAALRVLSELVPLVQLIEAPSVSRWALMIAGTGLGLYMLWKHVWILDAVEVLRRKQKRFVRIQQRVAMSAAGFSDPSLLPCLYETLPAPSQRPLCALDWSFRICDGPFVTPTTPIGDMEINSFDDSLVRWIKARGLTVKYVCQPANSVPGELRLLSAHVVDVAVSRGWTGPSAAALKCVSISHRAGDQTITVSARSYQDLERLFTPGRLQHSLKIGFCSERLMASMKSKEIEGVAVSEDAVGRLIAAGAKFARLRQGWEIEHRCGVLAERHSLRVAWLPDLWSLATNFAGRLLAALHIRDLSEDPFYQAYAQWQSALRQFLSECRSAGLSAVCWGGDWSSCGEHALEAGLSLAQFCTEAGDRMTVVGSEAACQFLLKTFATECI